jgi:aerobic carbon-monoxide dehydrogenase medium subunit
LDKVTINAPSVLCALGGELVVKGPDGEQTIPALKSFKDYLFTALGPQAVVTEVHVPKLGSKTSWPYKKFARRVGTLGRRLVAGGGSG